MPTLEDDELVFRFPDIEPEAKFSIAFQRTLRIPDTNATYSLPPGLGRFPLRHTEDYASQLPHSTKDRGGVIMPMWQAEAMWMNFNNTGPEFGLYFPVAVKIAAGKINAVTGETWRPGLHRRPQDYVVSPEQLWLDGFAIEKGVIRQFVAMPLGDGYSVEEQLTGKAEWGGLQIVVVSLKKNVWQEYKSEREGRLINPVVRMSHDALMECSSMMALGAGGRMHQDIYEDDFKLDDWDYQAAERVFVSIVHAKDWKHITGSDAPNEPPTAKDYNEAGLPWFQYYGKDQKTLSGGKAFAGVKSVAKMFKGKTGATLPNSEDIAVKAVEPIAPVSGLRPIKTHGDW